MGNIGPWSPYNMRGEGPAVETDGLNECGTAEEPEDGSVENPDGTKQDDSSE
jgi:hypothetical protein